jgi:hypothetical protein
LGSRHQQPQSSNQEWQSLDQCPCCGSALVQPQGWKELANGCIELYLRCPECLICTSERLREREVAEYDKALVKCRQSMVAVYETVVRSNMEDLVECFSLALAHDLIGPDDFAPGPRQARC